MFSCWMKIIMLFLAHAKAPLDGFEQQFGAFLQHELFERQRNQSQ